MSKISMGRAIGDAYDFTFGRYFSVLGVVWLPLALIVAFEFFVFAPYVRSQPDFLQYALQHPHDRSMPAQWPRMNGYIASFNLVIILISIWMRVGITKAALDLPRGPRFAYFFLGLDEMRVTGAYLVFLALLYGALFAAAIVILIVAAIIGALYSGGVFAMFDATALAPWAIGAAIATGVAFLCALIYFQARLVFLLVPVTISEKRFGLWRSWELSKGNFWRIVVVAIGTISPMLVFEILLLLSIYVPIIIWLVSVAHHHPEILHNRQMANVIFASAAFKRIVTYLPFTAFISLFLTPIFCGLAYAPSAYAYRSLMANSGQSISG